MNTTEAAQPVIGRYKTAANSQNEEHRLIKFFSYTTSGQLADRAVAKRALLILGIVKFIDNTL
ncbi:MAG: hypothetical protein D8M57_06705 [Candidatus Scalindua sp. AMX11]|nr:MAG: hypothetical protein DWQ00_13690 [Candidatus Scalindua sp.]NOG85352.1 hypothetical protein [Planctomycetota bacterium]RZV83954.1 MAG: hypothetical protein EX341_08435 [Candidatus Scalindua sp. SCAELEC01]TDE65771.1 MAG: hypothetical protein D8M57_06705 [Candidatus Scalindua sp. AMX11]